jgi:hypothetical protein
MTNVEMPLQPGSPSVEIGARGVVGLEEFVPERPARWRLSGGGLFFALLALGAASMVVGAGRPLFILAAVAITSRRFM